MLYVVASMTPDVSVRTTRLERLTLSTRHADSRPVNISAASVAAKRGPQMTVTATTRSSVSRKSDDKYTNPY